MAAKKNIVDPIIALEMEIAACTEKLNKARQQQITAAERNAASLVKKLASAKTKLATLRDKAKIAKTPASALKAKAAVAVQRDITTNLNQELNAAKLELSAAKSANQ